jgi:hypothetical protein
VIFSQKKENAGSNPFLTLSRFSENNYLFCSFGIFSPKKENWFQPFLEHEPDSLKTTCGFAHLGC